jgi:hypothetical protein
MIVAAHWKMRDYLHEFKGGAARLPVLMALTLHANPRLRCWPSTALLCKETGYNKKTVVEARQWLLERKAIRIIDYDKREGDETKLPQRQFIYQLTGMIMTENNGLQPYLNMTPETEEADRSELGEGVNGTPSTADKPGKGVNGVPFEGVKSESSLATPKGIKDSKDNTNKEDKELADTPTAVSAGEGSDVPNSESETPPEPPVKEKPKPKPKGDAVPAALMNPMKDAIARVFEWSWDGDAPMTEQERGKVYKAARSLCKAKLPPEEIPQLFQYCQKYDNISPLCLASHVSDYRKDRKHDRTNGSTGRPRRAPEDHRGDRPRTSGSNYSFSEVPRDGPAPEHPLVRAQREAREAAESAELSDV